MPTATAMKSDLSFGQLCNRSLPGTCLSKSLHDMSTLTPIWHLLENTLLSDIRFIGGVSSSVLSKVTQVLAGFPIKQTRLSGYLSPLEQQRTDLFTDCQVKAAPTVAETKAQPTLLAAFAPTLQLDNFFCCSCYLNIYYPANFLYLDLEYIPTSS